MANLLKRFSVTALACLLSFFLVIQYALHEVLPLPSTGTIYIVEKGMTLKQVARDMHQKGLMPHPRLFEIVARLKGEGSSLHAGEYFLPPSMNLSQLLEKMVRGEVVQHTLRIAEGSTWKEMLKSVQENPYLTKTLNYNAPPQAIAQQLGLQEKNPEGLFFPDTYYFPRGETDVAFLARAHSAMQRVLKTAWANRAEGLPYKDAYQALIAASIIEKETGIVSERPEVSGVIVRRLQKNMPLQMDPTVIYGLGDAYQEPLTRADLRKDTPYNTYIHYRLPPTPIALPSAASIQAAMQPNKGDSLYFVAMENGRHYFSATLAEHMRAIKNINDPAPVKKSTQKTAQAIDKENAQKMVPLPKPRVKTNEAEADFWDAAEERWD